MFLNLPSGLIDIAGELDVEDGIKEGKRLGGGSKETFSGYVQPSFKTRAKAAVNMRGEMKLSPGPSDPMWSGGVP